MSSRLALTAAIAALLAPACSSPSSTEGSHSSQSADTTAAPSPSQTTYADADYAEGFDLTPGGEALSGVDPNAATAQNTADPQRPPNMPMNFLYIRETCGPTACSNMYDLFAQPGYLSPRWAFRNGCIADPNDFQGGTNYSDIERFLDAQLPGQTWTDDSTDFTQAGSESPDFSWQIVVALIDAHTPFVAGVSWDDTPSTDSVGHVLSVVDYEVVNGLRYVLLMNFGHYKWYPWTDGDPAKLQYGFHTRWHVNDGGKTYARIHSDTPIADAVWASWHSQD
jgi:hypothetical protein